MRERNDCHGDEAWNAAVDRKPERDPDDESQDFYAELEKDLSAQRRNEIALAATPEAFRKMWVKL